MNAPQKNRSQSKRTQNDSWSKNNKLYSATKKKNKRDRNLRALLDLKNQISILQQLLKCIADATVNPTKAPCMETSNARIEYSTEWTRGFKFLCAWVPDIA